MNKTDEEDLCLRRVLLAEWETPNVADPGENNIRVTVGYSVDITMLPIVNLILGPPFYTPIIKVWGNMKNNGIRIKKSEIQWEQL